MCSIDGCVAPVLVKKRGWCSAHYARWQRHGDPCGVPVPKPRRFCSIDGCGSEHYCRGWCHLHYRRWRQKGNPLAERYGYQRRTTPRATVSPSIAEIHWAAGFLEGEGCFQGKGVSSSVIAAQKVPEPLYRLQAMFGGSVAPISVGQSTCRWLVCGMRARGVIFTIYTMMSLRRRAQMRRALGRHD